MTSQLDAVMATTRQMRGMRGRAENEAPGAILSRAEELLRMGKIGSPELSEDFGKVSSVMRGSKGEEYHVELNVGMDIASGRCDCEFKLSTSGVPCKHLTAIALWTADVGVALREAAILRSAMGKAVTPRGVGGGRL